MPRRNVDAEALAIGRVVWRYYRKRAGVLVAGAVKEGHLPHPRTLSCNDCGVRAVCYDHRDYADPLTVVPVCQSCNVKRGPARLDPKEVKEHVRVEARRIVKSPGADDVTAARCPSHGKVLRCPACAGSKGGESASPRKVLAARENGKKNAPVDAAKAKAEAVAAGLEN